MSDQSPLRLWRLALRDPGQAWRLYRYRRAVEGAERAKERRIELEEKYGK